MKIREAIAMRMPAAPEVGNEPLQITPGQSLDLGPLVDDANVQDAGGYPDTDALGLPDTTLPARTAPRRRRPLRRLVTARYSFALAANGPAMIVTPSGIDGQEILTVTLVANEASRVRYGGSGNDAQAGAFLPAGFPVTIGAGPVWLWPVSGAADTTTDVTVVYADPGSAEPPEDCGCHK